VAGARRRSPVADTGGAPAASTLVLDDRPTPTAADPADVRGPGGAGGRPRDSSGGHATTGRTERVEKAETDVAAPARGSGGLWASAIGAALALALLAASLVYALRPAVSDADRTAAVGSARTTLESLLSYSGSAFDKHVGEVTPQLTSPFKDQFTKVAATDIKPMAVKNDATVQAKVYDAGVMDADGDGGEGTTVRVMAFVNQATTTKAQQAPAIDQNRVIATMRKVGDRWLVSELSAF
jgi:Mce-associated membrane protein